ncbi:MAG: hypothetical protein RIS35_3431 [Pseudomonadota bacterium]
MFETVFVRYFLASVFALGVDYLILGALVQGLTVAPGVAGAVAYGLGALAHYGISRRFVFPPGWLHHRRRTEFAGFLATGLLGLCATVAILEIGDRLLGWPWSVSKTLAVGFSFGLGYLLRRRFVFRG